MMVSIKRAAAALVLALAACGAPSTPQLGGERFTAPYEVFDGERALELLEQCSRPAPGPADAAWTPSEAEITAMEPALLTLLREQLANAGSDADPTDYIRQYGGLVVGGRRIVYVNGFASSAAGDLEAWRSYATLICDGGPIAFGVEYDPETRAFANFAFNGGL